VILGCLVGLAIVLVVNQKRHLSQIEAPEGEFPEDGP
jgi:MFS superfamily sulfate permease-like transporter